MIFFILWSPVKYLKLNLLHRRIILFSTYIDIFRSGKHIGEFYFNDLRKLNLNFGWFRVSQKQLNLHSKVRYYVDGTQNSFKLYTTKFNYVFGSHKLRFTAPLCVLLISYNWRVFDEDSNYMLYGNFVL